MKRTILIAYSLLICSISLFGQLKKGDIEIGHSSSFTSLKETRYGELSKNNSFRILPSIGFMTNDKTMLGAGMEYLSSKGNNYFSGDFSNRTISLSPFFRYYFFRDNKFMPFIFFESRMGHIKRGQIVDPICQKSGSCMRQAGLGRSSFCHPIWHCTET